MKTSELKSYYEKLFAPYPDVVELPAFRKMMGGISESFARRLLKQKIVKSFYIHSTYFIPKAYILDYIVSDEYQNYKHKLKHPI